MSNSEPTFRETSSTSIALGLIIGTLGTTASSLANVLVKLTHEQNIKLPEHLRKPGYKRPLWYLVFFLYIANGVLDFMAYAFAPLSVVAPVAALTIVSNAVLARIFFKEQLTGRDIVASCIIVVGAGAAAATGSRQAPDRNLDELLVLWRRQEWIFFMSFEIAMTFVFVVVTRVLDPKWPGASIYCSRLWGCDKKKDKSKHELVGSAPEPEVVPSASPLDPSEAGAFPVPPAAPPATHHSNWRMPVRAIAYAFLGASFGSWTNLLGKSAAELIARVASGSSNGFNRWESWVMLVGVGVTAVLQLRTMSEMMANFEAVLIIPIYQCVFLLWLIICGAVYFDEFRETPLANILAFTAAIIVSMAGIFILAGRKPGGAVAGGEAKKEDSTPIVGGDAVPSTILSPRGDEPAASPHSEIEVVGTVRIVTHADHCPPATDDVPLSAASPKPAPPPTPPITASASASAAPPPLLLVVEDSPLSPSASSFLSSSKASSSPAASTPLSPQDDTKALAPGESSSSPTGAAGLSPVAAPTSRSSSSSNSALTISVHPPSHPHHPHAVDLTIPLGAPLSPLPLASSPRSASPSTPLPSTPSPRAEADAETERLALSSPSSSSYAPASPTTPAAPSSSASSDDTAAGHAPSTAVPTTEPSVVIHT